MLGVLQLSVPLTGTKIRKRPFQWAENGRFGLRSGRFGIRNGHFGIRNGRFGGRFGFRKGTKTNGYEKERKSHAKEGVWLRVAEYLHTHELLWQVATLSVSRAMILGDRVFAKVG